MLVVNPDDKDIWNRQFNVVIDVHLPTLHVYANCAVDALDEAVDYAALQGWEVQASELDLEDIPADEIIYAGNNGIALDAAYLSVVDVTGDDWD